jgi:hypothetical protein
MLILSNVNNRSGTIWEHKLLFYTFAFLLFNSMVSGDLNDARLLFVFIPIMLVKEIE